MKVENPAESGLSGSGKEAESDMEFISRLKELVAIAGSINALAKQAGMSPSGLQRYLAGGEPTRPVLIALAATTGVNLLWLAMGEGPKRPGDESDYAHIPLYDARISSGHGAWNDGAKVLAKLAFTRYSLRKKGLDPSTLCCVQNDGDSNEPELCDGDTVMVDLSRNRLQGDALYVIRLGDSLLAKRLQRQFGGGLQIISANPAYAPMTVPPEQVDDLQIVGRAVWAGGWLI